jgi:hypothetical protein
LIAVGLATQPLSSFGEMAAAYLMVHASQSFWPVVNRLDETRERRSRATPSAATESHCCTRAALTASRAPAPPDHRWNAWYGVLPRATVSAANENVCTVGGAGNPSQRRRRAETEVDLPIAKWAAGIGIVCYVLWAVFHPIAANAAYDFAEQSTGMARGRLLQDAFHLLFFAVAGIVMAVVLNWRNDSRATG